MNNDNQEDKTHFSLEVTDHPYSFGRESNIDGFHFDEYGIDFGPVSVGNIKPKQMIELTKSLVNHLILNGYSFEIKRTHQQDQHHELVQL